MAIHVDLNTTILSEGHRAFLARPGRQYRHFNTFTELSAIGPDLPFVELKPGVSVDEQHDIENMLKRAVAYRRWRETSLGQKPPPRNLEHYQKEKRVRAASSSQFKLALKGYFEIAKKGELALIPNSA